MALDITKFTDTDEPAKSTKKLDLTKFDMPRKSANFEDVGAVTPEQAGKSMLYSLSFGIDADEDAKDPAILEAVMNDNPQSRITVTQTGEILDRAVRRRVPELRIAPEATLFEKIDSYFKDLTGVKGREQGAAVIAVEAKRRGLTPEQYKREVFPEGEGIRRMQRYGKDIAGGGIKTIEGLAGMAQWVSDGEIGQDLANQAQLWYSDLAPSPEEVNFVDNVFSGVGSMMTFYVPGAGVAQGMKLLMPISRRIAMWGGTSVMTSLEASTEAGLVWRDVMRKTGNKEEADKAATTTFWMNMPLLLVTNKLGIFADNGSVMTRAIRGSVLEGGQEAGQEGISGFATNEMPTLGDLATAFGVGAITGGGVSMIQGVAQAKSDAELTAQDKEFIKIAQEKLQEPKEVEEVAPVEAPKDIDTLIEQGLTDDQITEQILQEEDVTEEAPALPTTEEKVALIQESLPAATNIAQATAEEVGKLAAELNTPASEAFNATMPNGTTITVLTGADIQPTAENIETIRQTYVKPGLMTEEDLQNGNFVLLGKNQAIGQSGVIALSREGETPAVLNEEVYELAEKTVLTPQEIAAVEAEFGTFEERSKAYAANQGTTQAKTLWQKIEDFFKGIGSFLKAQPTAEEVFRRVREGEVFARAKEAAETGETFSLRNTETKAFKDWFKGSKVVDENGEPLVVYHGTAIEDIFDAFELQGFSPEENRGFFFSSSPGDASRFAGADPELGALLGTERIIPAYLSIKTPLVVDMGGARFDFRRLRDFQRTARSNNNDGIIINNVRNFPDAIPTNTYISFEPTQIKSIFNQGTFDPNDPRITFALEPKKAFEFEDILEEEREASQKREEALKGEIKAQIAEVRKARTEGRREAAETAKQRIQEIRTRHKRQMTADKIQRAGKKTLVDTMTGNLPMALRAKFTKPLVNAKTPKQLSDVGERIIDAIDKYQESLELKKKLGTKRSKIAYVRKINEINQTVINDIKKELDISKPLSKMDETELDRVLEKLSARVRFKRSRGYRPKIEGRNTKKPEIPESLYEVNRNIRPTLKGKVNKKISDTIEDSGQTVEAALGIISTRLANIHPSLRTALRKFEFNLMTSVQNDKRAIVPYLEKVKKMSREDQADMDLAVKNGDTAKIDELVEKYDMVDEFVAVRKTLDALYKRADSVGFDIGYKENYFPRMVKDSARFLNLLSEREDWSILEEAIKRKELDLGRFLTNEEKTNLVNTMIRGYSGGQITLSATGNMKERIIDFVTPEMNEFYQDSTTSLVNYIDSVNEAIESRKFFGKEKEGVSLDIQKETELEDSIGAYITKLMTEGTLQPSQEKEIRAILTSRFSQKGTHGIVGVFKNLAYLTVMGSVFNAITQIGDLSFTIYAGGLRHAMPEIAKAALGKSTIKKEDLGIERIATEMEDPTIMSQLVDKVFRITGLTQIDRIGKEALVNSVVRKYMNQAQQETVPTELTNTLNEIFGTDAEAVLTDLKNEYISENVKYLAFSELLNFQPIALSEVPELYLRGGNGRVFYMLKTWTIKMFDVYRNEVYNEMKTDPVQGLKNLIRLTVLLMAMNATADTLKDLLLGREIKLDDLVVDNIAKLIGFSRYATFQVQREGLGSTVEQQILPPAKVIDDISRDVIGMFKDWDENAEIDKLRTPENIPVIGKLYYWWLGRGAEIKEKRKRRRD